MLLKDLVNANNDWDNDTKCLIMFLDGSRTEIAKLYDYLPAFGGRTVRSFYTTKGVAFILLK